MFKKLFFILAFCSSGFFIKAQGPPILTDKPIMLGEKRIILKTLAHNHIYEDATYLKVPLMAHYIIKPNLLVAVHLPYASFTKDDGSSDAGLGDISATIKYQFFRRDQSSKTFRAAAKLMQLFPTGISSGIDEISLGEFQTHVGLTAGYEALRYGLGVNLMYHDLGDQGDDFFMYKGSVGVPLMPLVYPPNQINLYFEYEGNIRAKDGAHTLYFAQGIQYAMKRITIESSIKVPLIKNATMDVGLKHILYFGARFII